MTPGPEERSRKLSRQIKRHLGDPDAEALFAEMARLLRSGQTIEAGSEKIKPLENFSSFIDVIEKSYAEYEDRLKIATRNIEISSKELTTAYRDLEELNANINAMLDGLGQGLLFFDSDGICSPVFSKSCITLLGTDPSGKPLAEVLNFSAERKNNFRSWLGIAFSRDIALSFEDLKNLLPGEMTNARDAIIELDYRPMYIHDDRLMGILLIATDVTAERESENRLQETQINAQKIQQIAQNRNGFYIFLTDFSHFIQVTLEANTSPAGNDDRQSILRSLHNFKGQASLFCLHRLSESIHEVESSLQGEEGERFALKLREELAAIEALMKEEKKFANELFGPDFFSSGQVKTLEVGKIHNLSALVSAKIDDEKAKEEILRFINEKFLSMNIFSAFLPFERELVRVAEQQGKAVPECNITGENLQVISEEFGDFINALPHLARNIVDHGLEPPAERREKGKSENGEVSINITKEMDNEPALVIAIKDNGRGIDPNLIRQILAERKQIDTSGESDEEVIAHIFDPEFSAKKKATLLSGRGMGMNALQDAVLKMDGTVAVKSDYKDDNGTTFTFRFPWRW